MCVLAEITNKWDISGVFCLTAIPCIIVVLVAYSKGIIAGSSTCLVFFLITVFATGNAGDYGSGITNIAPNKAYIANRSQSKMFDRYKYSINDPYCIFRIRDNGTSSCLDDYALFIPAEEMFIGEDGCYKMKSTGEEPTDDDYYLYDETIDPINAPVEAGGWGVPQWVYHPAAPTWIFGIAGLPALLGGMFIASKLRD